jgi:uncharacterized protein
MVRGRRDGATPRWLVSQRWEDVLFAHWPVAPRELRPLLPTGVDPDVREGDAWISIVAFVMVGTRGYGAPAAAALAPIPELNVRTYVRVEDVPAVWFLSLDATSRFFASMGRLLYGLRYHLSRMLAVTDGEAVHYLSRRRDASFAAAYVPTGEPALAGPGTLEHFLVERYRLVAERRGRLITAEVEHEAWPLQAAGAEISLNRMAPPGVAFSGEPVLQFCRGVEARISAPEPLARLRHTPSTRRRASLPARNEPDRGARAV